MNAYRKQIDRHPCAITETPLGKKLEYPDAAYHRLDYDPGWEQLNCWPVFQPILNTGMDGLQPTGFEALMRFQNTDIEKMLKAARKARCISSFDFFCRKKALEHAAEWFAKTDSNLFLNVCPDTLLAPDHEVGRTTSLANNFGIDTDHIVLEITEEAAIKNYNIFTRAVDHYKSQGYQIAIDDFGAGYAGLKMLSIIEPDFLKIDRHFIHDIHRNHKKHYLVETLVSICREFNITLIAEGIEKKEEFESIQDLGISHVQGYYLRKPARNFKDFSIAQPGQ